MFPRCSNLVKAHIASTTVYTTLAKKRVEVVHFLIQNGANNWNYGLEGACKSGCIELIQLMIQHGANDWETGLYYACADDNIDIVKELIHLCPNVNCVKIARNMAAEKFFVF